MNAMETFEWHMGASNSSALLVEWESPSLDPIRLPGLISPFVPQ